MGLGNPLTGRVRFAKTQSGSVARGVVAGNSGPAGSRASPKTGSKIRKKLRMNRGLAFILEIRAISSGVKKKQLQTQCSKCKPTQRRQYTDCTLCRIFQPEGLSKLSFWKVEIPTRSWTPQKKSGSKWLGGPIFSFILTPLPKQRRQAFAKAS